MPAACRAVASEKGAIEFKLCRDSDCPFLQNEIGSYEFNLHAICTSNIPIWALYTITNAMQLKAL